MGLHKRRGLGTLGRRRHDRVSDSPRLAFILPTLHYFVELPIRATEAEFYRYVGTEEVHGETYDVVYFTWGSVAANADYDQFLAYISQATGRIAKVRFTVRDSAPHIKGVAHLLDMTQVGESWLPARLPITPTLDADPAEAYMHEFRFEAFSRGTGSVQTFP